MTIVHRYIVRETLRVGAIVMIAVVAVYLAVDFFEKVDDFLERGVALSRALVYFTFKLPFVVAQMLPLCLLLALLIALGLMNRHNEIMALRAGGVSPLRLMRPALALGVLAALTLFFLAEGVVPVCMDRANGIWLGEVRRTPMVVSREENIWVRTAHTISHIRYYHAPSGTAHGITVNRLDDDFRLVERLDAATGRHVGGRWHLEDVMAQRMGPGREALRVRFLDRATVALDLAPGDLQRAVRDSREMSFAELRRYTARVQAEGYDATPYRVDLQAKVAFPAVCLILAMVGGGIGLHRRARESLVLATALGLGVAFLYWVFYSFCLSLGYGEMLPPPVAAWAANFVFLCVGALVVLGGE